jgi:GT2 family glycosyltransferase
MPNVWAIVLNFKAADLTQRAVESLLLCEQLAQVLVLDNGSGGTDFNSLYFAFAKEPRVQVQSTHTNLGYAGGMQFGIQIANNEGAEFAWLVNNDCVVPTDALRPLLAEMAQHPLTGACSGIVMHPRESGVPPNGGSNYDFIRGKIRPVEEAQWRSAPRLEVDFVAGSAWLIRLATVRRAGGLDCRLFLLGEEPDWCLRAKRLGFSSVVVPTSHVEAEVSATLKRYPCESLYYGVRNSSWIVRRHGRLDQRLTYFVYAMTFRFPKALVGAFFKRRSQCLWLTLRGFADGLWRSCYWSDSPAAALSSRLPSIS